MTRQMPDSGNRVSSGEKRLEWVPIGRMRMSPRAQRSHNSPSSRARIDYIANHFDPDKFGTPVVSFRDDVYWVIDGGHRCIALLQMGWADQSVQCWTYHELDESDEADKFLSLNDIKPVSAMDRFQRSIVAKRETETDIDRIARAADLSIGSGSESIGCVGAVTKTYRNGGPRVLATTMRIIRDAYGLPGFSAKVTEGIGLFVANYENVYAEGTLIQKLSAKKGGVNGLIGEAERIKGKFGVSLAVGVAAATVETYNGGRGGAKLNGWWSTFTGKPPA